MANITKNYNKIAECAEVFTKPLDYSVGTTPSEIIFCEDKMKLVHYIPTNKVYQVPILIVYALVNRYYILDLQSDKSVIRKLLGEGFDIYLVDWGYPSGSDKYLTLDDYINGYLNNAIDTIRKRTDLDKITLIGVCQGGTFSVIYSSLYPEKIKNLVTLVTPINFDVKNTDKSILHAWAKSLDIDKIVDSYGIIPGDFLNTGFLLLDPFRLMIDKYVDLFDKIECKSEDKACESRNEETIKNFLRMEKWIFDSPDQAGETFRQFMKDCYQKNLLIKNEMVIGRKINLKNITAPLLNIVAEYDHLVPNDASLPLADAISSTDKQTIVFPTGHIGIFVGSKSQKEVCPKIAEWLKPRSIPPSAKAMLESKEQKQIETKQKQIETKQKQIEIEQKQIETLKITPQISTDSTKKLKDKVVIITGAGSGIGKETALLFAKEGAKVVVTDINENTGKNTIEEITQNKGEAIFAKLDVSNREQSKRIVKDTLDKYGKVDILINNAGIIQDALISKMTEEQWDNVISIDLKGPFNMIQAVADAMIGQGNGKIINVSSIVGIYGNIGQTNYAAAKSGLIGMTKSLARELGKKGIIVNAIAPGFIETPMTTTVPGKFLDMIKEKTPLKRLGKPEDVANALLFLASDDANFVNGAVLTVDGGLII